MCRIAITGDCHGERHLIDVWNRHWRSKPFDVLVIAGDAGYVWDPSDPKEQAAIKAIDACPFDVLVVPGNHENYREIYSHPLEDYCGGRVYRISEKLRYAQHGSFFRIHNIPVLTFGGAMSTDKEGRIDGMSWWKEEIPNYEDCARVTESIGKYYYYLGFGSEPLVIITHTIPEDIVDTLNIAKYENNDPVSRMLGHIRSLLSTTQPISWHFGHWHKDGVVRKKDNITYYGHYHRVVYVEDHKHENKVKEND